MAPNVFAQSDSSWLQRAQSSIMLAAQDWLKIKGSAALFAEAYTVPSGVQSRRPPGTVRMNVQATLTLFDQFIIPLELLLSTEQVQFRQPFNQLSLAPQIGKNVKLYAGFHTLTLSALSAGDVRINGGGADVKLGRFRILASAGQSQRAAVPDTTTPAARFTPPTFAQTMLMGRVMYESDSGAVLGMNIVRARDDAGSVEVEQRRRFQPIEAKDNLVLSLDAAVPLFLRTVQVQAELAASRSGALWAEARTPECGFIAAPVVSADKLRLDWAARGSVDYSSPTVPLSIRLRGEYIGPGYTTLAYPQLVNDRFEADVAAQLRLLDGRCTLGGSIGYATDNLAGDRATTASRIIGSANVSAQLIDEFGFDIQYQNYGIRVAPPPNFGVIQQMTMPVQLQTQQVFGMISIAPRASFQIGSVPQNVSLTASLQQFSDANPETRRATENSSAMARLLWNTTLQKLSLTLNAGYTNNASALAQFRATDAALTVAHPLFDAKVTPALTLGWTRSSESSGLESRFSATLRASYKLTKQLDAALNAQGNYYVYRPGSRSPSYAEAQISIELRQRF